jgi:hypothetical protein
MKERSAYEQEGKDEPEACILFLSEFDSCGATRQYITCSLKPLRDGTEQACGIHHKG